MPSELLKARLELPIARPSAARRRALSDATDAWLQRVAELAGIGRIQGSLVAVGGYGRAELGVRSDLDLVLIHPNTSSEADVSEVANKIWYPIWDAGIALDHSVRTFAETRRLAAQELKVSLGLLDARLVAGDPAIVEQVRSSILADWRALAPSRLPELREQVEARIAREHEIAHLLEPDLKESYGGLRDVTMLRAIAASWVADYAHADVDPANEFLLDVRDALQLSSGRATSKLTMQDQAAVAELLGFDGDDALLRAVIDAGRAVAYASDVTWRRVARLTRKQPLFRRRRNVPDDEPRPLADGVIAIRDEVVLARDARPEADPVLLLRTAAAAAQSALTIAPETVNRFAGTERTIPQPWPRAAREALVSFLGAGVSAIPVWEALDNAGCLTQLLPYWENVRSAPQRNALHIYTIDRHQVQTAAHAAEYARDVARPDLLLVAALFHDIGKGRGPNHSAIGADLMRDIAYRMGFSSADIDVLVRLVAHHLLLAEAATRRDPEDPATVATIADAVGTSDVLDLLHALTKADSRASAPGVWSDWKSRLVDELVVRTRASLAGEPIEQPEPLAKLHPELLESNGTTIVPTQAPDGVRILIATDDRIGLLSTVAGALSLLRLDVRAARVETLQGRALQSWMTVPTYGEAPADELLLHEIRQAITGVTDLEAKFSVKARTLPVRRGFVPPPPVVRFLAGASERADVLEVRAHDAPALLWKVTNALAHVNVDVAGARVATLGSEVIDVLYVSDADGSRLSEHRRAEAVEAIRGVLAAD